VKPWARWAILAASVLVLVVLFVLLRPDDEIDGASPTPSSPTVTETSSPSESASPTPSESQAPDRTVIEVTYRNGAVQGPTSFTVTQGERVRLLVHADVSDEVHFHGYDLSADVTPQEAARIDFAANAAGEYEVELEGAGERLFELEIVP
jgi:FtsP/CotA-like multicopper oxidase with cupredoxin domain